MSTLSPHAILPEDRSLRMVGIMTVPEEHWETCRAALPSFANTTKTGTDGMIFYNCCVDEENKKLMISDAYTSAQTALQHASEVQGPFMEVLSIVPMENIEFITSGTPEDIDFLISLGDAYFGGAKKSFFKNESGCSFYHHPSAFPLPAAEPKKENDNNDVEGDK